MRACLPVCMDMHGPFAHVIGMQEPMCDHLYIRYISIYWYVMVCVSLYSLFEIVQHIQHHPTLSGEVHGQITLRT